MPAISRSEYSKQHSMAGFGLHSSQASSPQRPRTHESGPAWTLLTVPDLQIEDLFGYAAALDGDTLAASAPAMALPDEGDTFAGGLAGAVYVFQRQGDGWTEGVKLTAADAEGGDQFGLRLALSRTGRCRTGWRRKTPTGMTISARI